MVHPSQLLHSVRLKGHEDLKQAKCKFLPTTDLAKQYKKCKGKNTECESNINIFIVSPPATYIKPLRDIRTYNTRT